MLHNVFANHTRAERIQTQYVVESLLWVWRGISMPVEQPKVIYDPRDTINNYRVSFHDTREVERNEHKNESSSRYVELSWERKCNCRRLLILSLSNSSFSYDFVYS